MQTDTENRISESKTSLINASEEVEDEDDEKEEEGGRR